jgi:lipopolysaccharide biosynthesis glycosyltransferase
MNIAICFDKNFQKWATVCLSSIVENYRGNQKIRLFILSDVKYEKSIPQLKRVLKNFEFSFDNPGSDFDSLPTGFHFNVTTYWRLALPRVLTRYGVEKAIYLDTDTLVVDDISSLFNLNLNDKYCGACLDIGATQHTKQMSLNQGFAINGGVLLMNVPKMNVIDWVAEAHRLNEEGRIRWVDQDVLNILLDGKIKLIDLKWNVQSGNFQNGYIGDVSIVHFTESGNTKPWSYKCKHFYIRTYNTYIRKSGFFWDYCRLESVRRIKKILKFQN